MTPGIRIPQIHWESCAGKVLTMEALPGGNVGRYLSGQQDTTVDLPQVGKRLAEAYLKQIFDVGVFHADPHPGNILIDPPATVGLIDFGQVGTLTDELMTQFVVLVYAAVNRETGLVVTTLGEMGALGADTDPRQLQRSLRFLIDKYEGLPLRSIDLGRLFSEFTHVIRDCDVVMPREVPMLVKALSMATNTAQRLDPDLNVLELLKPKLKQALMQRVSPQRLARSATVSSFQLWGMLRRTPGLMSEALRRLATGTWELEPQARQPRPARPRDGPVEQPPLLRLGDRRHHRRQFGRGQRQHGADLRRDAGAGPGPDRLRSSGRHGYGPRLGDLPERAAALEQHFNPGVAGSTNPRPWNTTSATGTDATLGFTTL